MKRAMLAFFAFTLVGLVSPTFAKKPEPCKIQFTVVQVDALGNVQQGISAATRKELDKKLGKKYPGICYAEPSESVELVFYMDFSQKGTYHGSETRTSSTPIVDWTPGSSTYGQTVATMQSQSSTPVEFDYPICRLTIEHLENGKATPLHVVSRDGLCPTYAGFCVANRHPWLGAIEDAVKWIAAGGLNDPLQSVAH
jgi:hypothetical protein